jgi:mRNA interferase MazF
MRYKIVLVPFPFDDLSGTKVRPAVCLTSTISNFDHIVIAFITSQITIATEPSDVPIMQNEAGFALTGLRVDSAIRLHRLITIPRRIILRELGALPPDKIKEVTQKLRTLFSI